MRASHGDVLATIRDEQELSKSTEAKLREILGDYAKQFAAA